MTRLEKYAKRYGDIPYPENISEKQAKKYVETYVKLGRSRGHAKGEVLKKYGVTTAQSGHLMILIYERQFTKIPSFLRSMMGKICTNPRFLTKMFLKKDRKNALNAAQNPGSFETQTQIPPEKGYDFSYHNLVCPLADFAKKYGYEEYMPYLCNLDYVMFGILGAPLYREHTCFDDGDYCDFKLKLSAKPMDYDPPVFTQGNGYK